MVENKWTIEVIKDPDTGELMLPLPTDLLAQMGWTVGTELFWEENKNGTYSLKEHKNGTGESK